MSGKKVELTLGQVESSIPVVNKLVITQMPMKTSYWISRSVRSISEEYKLFSDQKQKLIDLYSVKENGKPKLSEDGRMITIIPEKIEEFQKEYTDLLNQKIEVTIYPILLSSVENLTFSPQEIDSIFFLFEVEEKNDN